MSPRLEACYFGDAIGPRWGRMARVLELTAREQCPAWSVTVRNIAPIPLNHRLGSRVVVSNTQKLEEWARIVANSTDGDRLLLIDADTFVVRPLDPVWALEFDVAITTRPGCEYPINGGVVFLRLSPSVRAFFETWRDVNCRMLHDPRFHQAWKRKYAGMNQAALGYVLEELRPDVRVVELPCLEWNCEDSSWRSFDPELTRIVHVKSALRMACLETQPIPEYLYELAARWKTLDRRARKVAA